MLYVVCVCVCMCRLQGKRGSEGMGRAVGSGGQRGNFTSTGPDSAVPILWLS